MRKILFSFIMLFFLFVTVSFSSDLTSVLDSLISKLNLELHAIDTEIDRFDQIVNKVDYGYCTKSDLVLGSSLNATRISDYKSNIDKLKLQQTYKLSLIEKLISDKETYLKMLEASDKSIIELISMWESESYQLSSSSILTRPTDNYNLTSDYGLRLHPIFNIEHFHTGIDLADTLGSNIYASADGIVIRIDYDYRYGNYLVLMHSEGVFTLYAHILDSGILVDLGNKVSRGQLIALMGSTGVSTGSHLHFEVYSNGIRQNPLNFLN